MNVNDTAFDREFSEVRASGDKPIAFEITAVFHAGGVDYPAIRVDELEIDRNYLNRFADRSVLTCTIGEGTLAGRLIPNISSLEVTVTKTPLQISADPKKDLNRAVEVQRYRAFLFDSSSILIESNRPNLANIQLADQTSLKTIQVQLLDHVVEKLRTIPVGGIFKNQIPINIIRAVLGRYGKLANDEAAYSVRGVDIAPGFSNETVQHVIVQHGTPLSKFPRAVENSVGGIYPTGFAYYLQSGMWYLFAPYDIKRFFKSSRNLTVLNIPANRLESIENSFRTTNSQLVVMATGDTKQFDNSEREQNNQGNAVRFLDASRMMFNFVKTIGNKAIASRANVSTETALEKRPSGIDLISLSERIITSNHMAEYSKLARRSGSFINLKWQNSIERLIYPGMPARLMYLNGGKDMSMYGVCVGTHTLYRPTNRDPKIKRFAAETQISLFVGRNHDQ